METKADGQALASRRSTARPRIFSGPPRAPPRPPATPRSAPTQDEGSGRGVGGGEAPGAPPAPARPAGRRGIACRSFPASPRPTPSSGTSARGRGRGGGLGRRPLRLAEGHAWPKRFGKAPGSRSSLTTRVEPEVLGGLLVRLGGKTYDGTVRGAPRALRARLVQELEPKGRVRGVMEIRAEEITKIIREQLGGLHRRRRRGRGRHRALRRRRHRPHPRPRALHGRRAARASPRRHGPRPEPRGGLGRASVLFGETDLDQGRRRGQAHEADHVGPRGRRAWSAAS